jgi:hypothetical protein
MQHPRRIIIAALAVLAVLVALAVLVMPDLLAPPPTCEGVPIVPIMPLGVDYPGFRLEEFGRSAMHFAPGETLCLALEWQAGWMPPAQDEYTIQIELLNDDDRVRGRYAGPLYTDPIAWMPGAEPVERYPIPISCRAAPGRYRIVVSVVSSTGEMVGEPATIGTVQVVRTKEK